MRRILLLITGLLAVGGLAACGRATAASAEPVWVEVSPSSVYPGERVAIRADCGDNSRSAQITSAATGTTSVQPTDSLLQTEVQISPTMPGGEYTITLTCPTGETATTQINVVNKEPDTSPTVGPHTGGGFLATTEPGDDCREAHSPC